MSGKSIVQRALANSWPHQQGLPELRPLWIALSYGPGGNAKSSIELDPPDRDPYVRWCGSRGFNPPGYPILLLEFLRGIPV